MPDSAPALERLVDSLLYEGYALYPYTPGATKNATPTPFGIVYPPVYASTLTSAFDHLELRCVLQAPADAVLSAEVRFLAAGGERHQAQARRVEITGAMVGALAAIAAEKQARVEGEPGSPPLIVGLSLSAERLENGDYEAVLRVEPDAGQQRARARRRAGPFAAVHPPDPARHRWPLHLAAGARCRQR